MVIFCDYFFLTLQYKSVKITKRRTRHALPVPKMSNIENFRWGKVKHNKEHHQTYIGQISDITIILYFWGVCKTKAAPLFSEATKQQLTYYVVMNHCIFTFRFVSPYILTDGGDKILLPNKTNI